MNAKQSERLLPYIQRLEGLEIPEVKKFCNGVKADIEAVKNVISLVYNNGLAEGNVNKIKLIKRVMYSRNSFNLLKAKVLFYEKYRFEIN